MKKFVWHIALTVFVVCIRGLAVGPILLMHLNESQGTTTFSDASGNGYDGSCSGGTCPTRGNFGIFNPACTFDGTDDVISGMNVGAAGTSDWTISAWVRTASTSAGMVLTNRVVAGTEISMSLHVGWWAGAASANGNAYYSNDGPGCEFGAQGSTNIANGNFHHLVGVRSGTSNYYIYVNGTQEGNNNASVGSGCQNASAASTQTWRLGNGPAWGSPWNGQIAEVSIYNEALSRSQIQALYLMQTNRFEEAYKKWFEFAGYPKFFFSKVFWS